MITRRLKESGRLVRKTLTIRILNLKERETKLLSRTVLKSKMTLLSLETTEHSACNLGSVSRKSRKLFGSEDTFVKLRPVYSVTLVFSYVVKGIKIKTTVKFCASRRPRFEDTKRIMSPEMRPKSFGTFETQAPGP